MYTNWRIGKFIIKWSKIRVSKIVIILLKKWIILYIWISEEKTSRKTKIKVINKIVWEKIIINI